MRSVVVAGERWTGPRVRDLRTLDRLHIAPVRGSVGPRNLTVPTAHWLVGRGFAESVHRRERDWWLAITWLGRSVVAELDERDVRVVDVDGVRALHSRRPAGVTTGRCPANCKRHAQSAPSITSSSSQLFTTQESPGSVPV